MIARLNGRLIEKQAPSLIIDCQGVGYEVLAPMTTFYALPELGADVTLHTHFSVSESAQQLFGFIDRQDRTLFRLLIKVNGVGPKMALAILSGMEASEFVSCVRDNNVSALVKVPGVGKKTAERLVIEMRDKLKDWARSPAESALQNSPSASRVHDTIHDRPDIVAEAESAMVALGYKPVEAAKAISAVLRNDESVERSEDLIRMALRGMLPKN